MKFDRAQRYYRENQINQLYRSPEGLRFLKLVSLSRKAHLEELFRRAAVSPSVNRAREMLREAYESTYIDDRVISKTITAIYRSQRKERKEGERDLLNQLYKMQSFDWGGLYQNSLERTIVNNYVKKIRDYDELNESIENELHQSMRSYVLSSWYNHWTSIITEDIFRDHSNVLPAVSQVKQVDFFVNDVPFDLKVTYLPEGYVKYRRQGMTHELTLLKQWASRHDMPFDGKESESRLLSDLWNKANDDPTGDGPGLLAELLEFRREIIRNIRTESSDLIRWLYENQGTARFDASNRLFLVLIDPSNFFESWKLKRARDLMKGEIKHYLDTAPESPGRDISFRWDDSDFTARADVILVERRQ